MDEAPVVPGLTQDAPGGAPLHVRLMDLLAQRPGGSTRKVADALTLLEEAASVEQDQRVRDRIAAGVALIRGFKDEDE
jgi:hypothetical protein